MSHEYDNPFAEHDVRKPEPARIAPMEQILIAIAASPIWLTCAWLMLVSVPRASKTFADFRMKLPYATEFVFAWGWIAVPALLLIACAVGLVLQRRWAVYLSFVVGPAILSTLVFTSIYMPLQQLVEALGGNNVDLWAIFLG